MKYKRSRRVKAHFDFDRLTSVAAMQERIQKTIAIHRRKGACFDFRRKKDMMLFLLRGKEPPARGDVDRFNRIAR
jgi:hypothetical protein